MTKYFLSEPTARKVQALINNGVEGDHIDGQDNGAARELEVPVYFRLTDPLNPCDSATALEVALLHPDCALFTDVDNGIGGVNIGQDGKGKEKIYDVDQAVRRYNVSVGNPPEEPLPNPLEWSTLATVFSWFAKQSPVYFQTQENEERLREMRRQGMELVEALLQQVYSLSSDQCLQKSAVSKSLLSCFIYPLYTAAHDLLLSQKDLVLRHCVSTLCTDRGSVQLISTLCTDTIFVLSVRICNQNATLYILISVSLSWRYPCLKHSRRM